MTDTSDLLAGAFDQAPCGLALLDGDGRIKAANAYLRDLWGGTAEQLDGANVARLLDAAGRDLVVKALAGERALDDLPAGVLRSDGASVPVRLNLAQVRSADGASHGTRLAVWRTTTHAPDAGSADFIANVSHEIRTPLSGVIGVTELLARTELSPAQKEMVELIQSSGRTLERLVSDILDASKMEAGLLTLDPQPFDLMAELGGLLDMVGLRAREKGLAFTLSTDPQVEGRYLGDCVRLKQVIGNLTANAVKFTQAGRVEVDIVQGDEGELVFRVCDTGIGFDEAAAVTLFSRFRQADAEISRRFGGTGLGLAICKSLVELMDGSIDARSVPGEGSVFTVHLPLPRVAAEPALAAEPLPADPEPDVGTRILLVEDNAVNQRLIQMMLEPYEVGLTIAGDGACGLEAWRAGDFDLVLMDMQMPVMDGLTALREIRRLEREEERPFRTPVAVLSANAMDRHQHEAFEAGADAHIAKPMTRQSLLEGIQRALGLEAGAAPQTA